MGRKILVVDDVEFVRKTLMEILRSAHYQIVGEAADGSEAVEMFKNLSPDLVTMDVVMPRVSGIDAAKKILRADKDARIVMITAMGQESLIMEAINAGVKDYILKPFNAADVLKTIERAMIGEDRGSKNPFKDTKA
ncbi:MAG: hypothetical protein A2583_00590 [Bdellovibrionales bacterium RIFOXYD1_FULL_53_11]|nr:MAG: hypothetical protein A2583_00590 [Bdellovibrionales bacterium RIFOXYD1_FULL_53_11]